MISFEIAVFIHIYFILLFFVFALNELTNIIIELILSNLNKKNQLVSLDHLEEIYKKALNDKLVFKALVYCGKNIKKGIN